LKRKQVRPQRRLLGGESAVEATIIIIIIKKTNLTYHERASRTGYKVNRNSTRKYTGECSYRLYDWL